MRQQQATQEGCKPASSLATGEADLSVEVAEDSSCQAVESPPPKAPMAPAAAASQRGVLVCTDGVYEDMPVGQRLLAQLTLAGFTSWLYVLGGLLLAALFSRAALTLAVLVCATLALPCHPVMWPRFLANPVMALWRRYLSFTVCCESRLHPSKHYIFACFPHSAFPLSQLLGLTARHRACWEGERFYGLAADAVFAVPLWRHVYTWLGIVPASAANLRQHLKWGCVAITPGGIAEMYMAGGDADHVYVRSRKGFVAVAVEEGVDIVPVYHFGNSLLLSFGPRCLQRLGRRCRVSLGLLSGAWHLPIPRRVALHMAVGAPVAVSKTPRSDPAFAEVVDETHARFVAALQELYDRHRGAYGWAGRPLVMH